MLNSSMSRSGYGLTAQPVAKGPGMQRQHELAPCPAVMIEHT